VRVPAAGASGGQVSRDLAAEARACCSVHANTRAVLTDPYARAWVRLSVCSTMVRQTDKAGPTQKRDKSGPSR